MIRTTFFILSVISLLASGARAEVTHMNCKFNEGWHQQGAKREDVKKMSDLTISIDKEKRRIKIVKNSPNLNNSSLFSFSFLK